MDRLEKCVREWRIRTKDRENGKLLEEEIVEEKRGRKVGRKLERKRGRKFGRKR